MQTKPKKCKGIGIANGFNGCGIETLNREHGLCSSCRYEFYMTDERGKIEFEKRKIKIKSVKEKAFKSDLKEKIKTLSDYEAEAKKVFQRYVRMRDKGLPCISCNNPNPTDWSGGHYFSAGMYSGLIFDERNCHAQCNTYCNKYLSGNLLEYRSGLLKRFGWDFVMNLELDSIEKRNYKYTKQELIDIKNKYLQKIKELNV